MPDRTPDKILHKIDFFKKRMTYGVAAEKLFHYKPLTCGAPIV